MGAPRTAAWLVGLGCLGLAPLHAAQALDGTTPSQRASVPAGETHAAPRVRITFDESGPALQTHGADLSPAEGPTTTASTTRRASSDLDLRTDRGDQISTPDVPTWSRVPEPYGPPDLLIPARIPPQVPATSPAETPVMASPVVASPVMANPVMANPAMARPDKGALPTTQPVRAEPKAQPPATIVQVPAPTSPPAASAGIVPAASIATANKPDPTTAPAPVAAAPAPAVAASAPATVPAPVAAIDPDPVAGALQARLAELAAALPRRLVKAEREALATYYVDARFHPVWVANGTWTAGANAVIARLKDAEEDGLDPADYPVPVLGLGGITPRIDNPAELAEAEFKLSAAALLYARDARGGRIDPARLSALITPKLELPGANALMTRLASAGEPGAVLAAYNPAYPGYVALKAKLAQVRAARPAGLMVRLPRATPGSTKLASLDGSVPPPRIEGDLIANMERWRWLPAEVGRRYILVNIPQFKLDVIEDGRSVHETRVIVGKSEAPTPVFSGEIEYAVVNPSWYIPPSIMKKEILPGLAADPSYAERRGYEVIRRNGQISVRQPPGERNALGFIKFMFPNQHAVYLHDTPNRNLFSASMRAFSHGCVRVDQPFALADFVLGREWPEARLKKMIGRGERTIRMATKLPVHLAYFTLTADSYGDVKTFGDLYGINRKVRLALGLGA